MTDFGSENPPIVRFSSGFLTLCVFVNKGPQEKIYYDIVLYRKIKTSNGPSYRRGANLKPTDLPHALLLYQEVKTYLENRFQSG